MKKSKIPQKLQSVLWSTNINLLDLERDKGYIIHQILSYGGIDNWIWLFKTYSKKEIVDVFLNVPYKDYFARRYYLVKNHLLELKTYNLNKLRYVKNIPRDIR